MCDAAHGAPSVTQMEFPIELFLFLCTWFFVSRLYTSGERALIILLPRRPVHALFARALQGAPTLRVASNASFPETGAPTQNRAPLEKQKTEFSTQ